MICDKILRCAIRQKEGVWGGTLFPPAIDIVERRVKIRLYTLKTENRLLDAENDELMGVIKLPSLAQI
jgi:hypothetical protein